jgi:hypothetical protein
MGAYVTHTTAGGALGTRAAIPSADVVGLAAAIITSTATIEAQLAANEGNILNNTSSIGTNSTEIGERLNKGSPAANVAQAVYGGVSWVGTQAESAASPVVQLLGFGADDTMLSSAFASGIPALDTLGIKSDQALCYNLLESGAAALFVGTESTGKLITTSATTPLPLVQHCSLVA